MYNLSGILIIDILVHIILIFIVTYIVPNLIVSSIIKFLCYLSGIDADFYKEIKTRFEDEEGRIIFFD